MVISNGWEIVLNIGFGVIVLLILLSYVLSSAKQEVSATLSNTSKFERINDIEGCLYVDGKKIKTYDYGAFTLDKQVGVKLYSDADGSVIVTDIEYYNQSIYAFAPLGLTYRDKADFAIQTLKHKAHQGEIPMDLVDEIEEVILEIDTLNRYIYEGKVKKLRNDDFAWVC
ncbi:hypothetical protein ACFX4N_23860 [Priestia sp. YIM B13551]|uniref:hypothetical protein n=1 Tax=Priestia sp. YIM B13551 TaxID=3366306 RepID=UPI00366D20C1